jgi:hypothetical protein
MDLRLDNATADGMDVVFQHRCDHSLAKENLRRMEPLLKRYLVLREAADGTYELVPVSAVFSTRLVAKRPAPAPLGPQGAGANKRQARLDAAFNEARVDEACLTRAVCALQPIDDGMQGDSEGLGGVDDGLNGDDDDAMAADKDDIDDEKALEGAVLEQLPPTVPKDQACEPGADPVAEEARDDLHHYFRLKSLLI